MIEIKRDKEQKNGRDPSVTNLDIQLIDEEAFGDNISILKIWPIGHSDQITHHGGCSGVTKCLQGLMRVQVYNRLGDQDNL